jgi:hypothetical protein
MEHNLKSVFRKVLVRSATLTGDDTILKSEESEDEEPVTKNLRVRPITFTEEAVTKIFKYLKK